jgi:histidinol phosphatase-like PHP family hydrolase
MNDNQTYKYDLHMHSYPCSVGGSPIRDHIDALIAKGYSGMVITNHFYNGNNDIDKTQPWADFVDAYWQDYLYGLEYARQFDFDLLFGLEEHVGDGLEILLYGITAEQIAAHPELATCDTETYVEIIHSLGGLVYQAHPFRLRRYIPTPGPLACLDKMDGIEVYNAGNTPEQNESAAQLAKELNLAIVAGSDGHGTHNAGRSGILTKERIRNNDDLIRILKSRDYTVIYKQ